MQSIVKKVYASLIVAFIFSTSANAQVNLESFRIGFNVGTMIYQGDLSNKVYGSLQNIQTYYGISLAKTINPYFAVRAALNYGKISHDESLESYPSWKQIRNLKFNTNITELSTVLLWNINGNNSYSRFSPYFLGGIAAAFTDVHRNWSKFNTAVFGSKSEPAVGLGIDTLHKTPTLTPTLPVGAGISYAITPRISVAGEMMYRFTFSDYIDGFRYTADANSKDKYYSVTIGITYQLGKGIDKNKCPPIRL